MADDSGTYVFFVGAGPGAVDLITVRGVRLLEKADVIVWAGSLVNGELLDFARKDAAVFDSSTMSLEETTRVLCEASSAKKLCVRLHTGDPSIFGAIREQMEELDVRGVRYEVVPGVSSFSAAAAVLKTEYTVPEISQSLIITRMEGRTPVPGRERLRAMAAHGTSMALFLSSSMIESVVDELLLGGVYTKETPAAVVYKATWKGERTIRGILGDIAKKCVDAGIKKTALILVGEFLGAAYNKSKLYDKTFETGFRKRRDV
ncbi:MAG: precorrin-4 C(11)-methyltransferase [Treponema sp.]|nr:precorrin-4 C(11)-methyltransferase [Treponema sp.]